VEPEVIPEPVVVEPIPEPEIVPTPEPETPKVEPKVEPKPKPKPETKPEPKPEPKPKPKVEPKTEPKLEPIPEPESYPEDDYIMDPADDSDDSAVNQVDYIQWLSDEILFSRALWSGLYSGIYSTHKSAVAKPSEQCLGDWIVQDMVHLIEFRNNMLTDYWNVPISEYKNAWLASGDLMFKNFDQCHFKAVLEDVNAYCSGSSAQAATEKVEDEWSKYDFDTELPESEE